MVQKSAEGHAQRMDIIKTSDFFSVSFLSKEAVWVTVLGGLQLCMPVLALLQTGTLW